MCFRNKYIDADLLLIRLILPLSLSANSQMDPTWYPWR